MITYKLLLWSFSSALGLTLVLTLNGVVSWHVPVVVVIIWATVGYQVSEVFNVSFGWPFSYIKHHRR